jgi:PAS domain S-box-containing protein
LDLGFCDNQASAREHVIMHEVEHLDTLYNTADGLFITDENQRILRWNAGAERLLGHTEAEAVNQHCFQIMSGQTALDRTTCNPRCKIHAAGIKGTPQENFDLRVCSHIGSAVWLNVTVLSNKDHEKPFITHIFRDVTEEKRKMLALEQFLNEVKPLFHESPKLLNKTHGDAPSASFDIAAANPAAMSLSNRETEVLILLAEGLTTQMLAHKLGISPFTARNHVQNILVKLNLHSKAQAVSYAFKIGIL